MYNSWRSAWCTKAELQRQPRRLPHAKYVLHRFRCSQEKDQVLRKGWKRHRSRRRCHSRHTMGSGQMDEDASAAKKKNDRIDANKIADCLRCDFLPQCYMASTKIRERRRTLRYRNLLVHQVVQLKNKISGLLMEAGVSYNKQKLHKVGYFKELLASNPDINEGLRPLLRLCRETLVRLQKTESALVRSLQRDSLLAERVQRLMTIPAVGPITALTWVLEVGDVQRFSSIKKAISYCGLCGAEKSSAETIKRTPISKQRNKHLQSVLVEAAKMAPRFSPELALIYDREKQKGNANRATLAVARKLVAYLVAIDRGQTHFLILDQETRTAA